jgi:hypothetical protein
MRRSKTSRPTWRPFEFGRLYLSEVVMDRVVPDGDCPNKVFLSSFAPDSGLSGPAKGCGQGRVLQRVHRSEAQTLDGGPRRPYSRSSGAKDMCHLHNSRSVIPKVVLSPPTCRASIRTLNGPLWVRCNLGSDFKPGSITVVIDPGCWGAAIYRAISKDQPVFRSHPNKAVDVVVNIPPEANCLLDQSKPMSVYQSSCKTMQRRLALAS